MKPNSVPKKRGVKETKTEAVIETTTENFLVPELKKKTKNITRQDKPRPVGNISLRTKFTHEMATRAREDGMQPVELLYAIAADPSLEFTDWIPSKGELIQVERTATLEERIDCAKAVLPYIAAKKIDVQHSGTVQVLHALAESALDATELDEQGNVIDADFDEIDDEE